MPAELIDGKAIAAQIRGEVGRRAAALSFTPGLATVIVGNRTDSATYVRMKHKACEECGLKSFHHSLPEDIQQRDLEGLISKLNEDSDVHGILVQLPLPKHINEEAILGSISLEKDVDGFHPINIGRLAMKNRTPMHVPCTPKGCIELLKRCGVEMQGKQAVVLGRSNIVGLPVALLLLRNNATVTICHTGTKDMIAETRRADILIAASGSANMVKKDWIKPGATVIDVGINSVEDSSRKSGYRLVGDVETKEAEQVAGKITPVPGGVGPMTIAMLLENCVTAAERVALRKEA
eukprot:CAMPEP_0198736218 /NCGR_PEP_ID=MMETSP1475-20131203/64270_1 /TAXON_ID= ORGANISM="Unidentified sp., Strain CCMP1999" /NCGR_SAMPLE_ID=MMETSP1475 /ASSEMBLY_ACC=CAM_ASM_001111 /LENGTH=292 /DNA_ID=CAMNT_0044499991 /DNA_START=115 /DNA_END=993 /DNA_ORIENTATION=+